MDEARGVVLAGFECGLIMLDGNEGCGVKLMCFQDDCKYECMRVMEIWRAQKGRTMAAKYFGKWHFCRVLGNGNLGAALLISMKSWCILLLLDALSTFNVPVSKPQPVSNQP